MRNRSAHTIRAREAAIVIVYLCATLQFVRYYSKNTILYLNMNAYLAGHERLPFQERVFPILLIRPLVHSEWIARNLVHTNGMYTAERGPLYLVSLVAILVAGFFVQKLYGEVSRNQTFKFMVYPLFLFAMMWSYSIHNEADFSYPYDMLSVAFFTIGLHAIYTRRFLSLVFVLFFGTFNRETTLFLIGIYILDAATRPLAVAESSLRKRFSPSLVPWRRVALLFAIWIVIKASLMHYFAHNDGSENYVRVTENIGRLSPRLWPALLNICGYMLPVVLLLRRYLEPVRFASYLYIFPIWVIVMFYTGVIVETRIYGELCSFTAISLTIIIENYVEQQARTTDGDVEKGEDWVESSKNAA